MPNDMVTKADVVVIGGGVIGLSVARELGRLGAKAVVLEANASPGLGSTSKSMGGVRAQFSTKPNIEFSAFSITAYEQLAAKHGDVLDFHQVGYLLLAGSTDTSLSLRASIALQRSLGVPTETLTPDALLSRAPDIRIDGIEAASYHARDGFLDPHSAITALLRDVRDLGGKITSRVQVKELAPQGTSGVQVRTTAGDLTAGWVVNAAGPDAAGISAMTGFDLPVYPVRRNLAFIEGSAAPLMPMTVDLDTGVVVRNEVSGGYVVAYADPADPSSRDVTLDPTFLPKLAARIGNRFPFLENRPVNSRQCWAGLYPETTDHHAVIGAFPDCPRVIHSVGFGGHGLMHGPAAGRAVAELITQGTCTTFDLTMLRPTRFLEGDVIIETAVF